MLVGSEQLYPKIIRGFSVGKNGHGNEIASDGYPAGLQCEQQKYNPLG
jgi:hypothetical protein